MAAVNREINEIAIKIRDELNYDVDLTIGKVEDPAQAVPVLIERMDNICGLMAYQSEIIKNAESGLEEAKYQYKRKDMLARQKINRAFVAFKQEDRPKPKAERRTDVEYKAMAELEAEVHLNEALSAERAYMHANHALDDEKHKYEILNNHFLAYRKIADMLVKEMNTLSGPRSIQNMPMGGGR